MQLSSCLCIFVSESSVAWCTPPLSGNPPYFILRDHRVSLLGFLALADSSTIFYNLLSPDIYIFFVTKFTSSHKNSTQVRYINNVMVKMVKSTNTLKATTLKSTSIQLPKLTNKVHWNLFVQSPPFRELESRTSIRNTEYCCSLLPFCWFRQFSREDAWLVNERRNLQNRDH